MGLQKSFPIEINPLITRFMLGKAARRD